MPVKMKSLPLQVCEVEGANGGSFVRIEQTERDGICHITVGHSCVVTCDCEIPVTWLAAILTHAKDIGFTKSMGDVTEFPADYALQCNPPEVSNASAA